MKNSTLALTALAAGVAALVLVPAATQALQSLGWSLSLDQRDVRIYDNFVDATANDNLARDPSFPGVTGARMAAWKAVVEWGSGPHGDGTGDPTQANLGDGGASFDALFLGDAPGVGSLNDNVMSAISGCGGGIIAFVEGPGADGWRMRFCEDFVWDDGPGPPPPTRVDLQGVATREYGHALGLGNSAAPGATMAPGTSAVDARSIEPDDIAAIQALYGVADPAKPLVDGATITVNLITITGANFAALDNEVWFAGGGILLEVTGVPSNGTILQTFLPAQADTGDVFVKVPGTTGASLSNAFPFDRDVTCDPSSYCISAPNSAGGGASITWFGTTSWLANDFGLSAGGAIPNEFGLFFYGPEMQQVPFGDGFLCVGGGATGIVRLNPPMLADPQGGMLRAVDFTLPPADAGPGQILPGSVFDFQYWYRDPAAGASGFNLSNGMHAVFCP